MSEAPSYAGHDDPYLDDLYDLPLADEGHLSEVKDWYTVQLLFSKRQESHQLTL
jgi:hypothetical protein